MKKYLALAVLGLMLTLVQPAFSQCGCGCPVALDPCCPQQVCPACPIAQPCQTCQPVCPACPVCPQQQIVYQPVLQQVQPCYQTVVEPVMSYRYRQVAVCPTSNPCCDPCGITGAAMPLLTGQAPAIIYQEKEGFWSDFFGFD